MLVLEATSETQGDRDDDYVWTVDGELVFLPPTVCCEPGCGCNRGFAGLASHRATTTALVTNRTGLDRAGYRRVLADGMRSQGYDLDGDVTFLGVVDELIEIVEAAGAMWGEGSVVGCSRSSLIVRRFGRLHAR